MWPEGRDQPANLGPNIQAGNALYSAIQALSPKDEAQRSLKAQAASQVICLDGLPLINRRAVGVGRGPGMVASMIARGCEQVSLEFYFRKMLEPAEARVEARARRAKVWRGKKQTAPPAQ